MSGTATTSVLLRLDRNPDTEAISAFFSLNDGGSWTPLGPSAVRPLANPRLAVFVGANGSTSSFPPADIAYVEIETPAPLAPALAVNPTSLSFSGSAGGSNPAGKNVSITNGGSGTLTWSASADQPWVTLSPSSGSAPSSLLTIRQPAAMASIAAMQEVSG